MVPHGRQKPNSTHGSLRQNGCASWLEKDVLHSTTRLLLAWIGFGLHQDSKKLRQLREEQGEAEKSYQADEAVPSEGSIGIH